MLDSIHYVVGIDDWAWSLSFGLGDIKSDEGAYRDYRHLMLRGRLLRPQDPKVQDVEVCLMPNRLLNEEHWPGQEPKAIGSIRIYRRGFTALLSMPTDALAPTLQAFSARRLSYVLLNAEQLFHGRALVRSYSLARTIDEDGLLTIQV